MYKVVNNTSKELMYKGGVIVPNQEVRRDKNGFYRDVFGNRELGACQIFSENNKYTSYCSGNLRCTPKSGEEGTTFEIYEY